MNERVKEVTDTSFEYEVLKSKNQCQHFYDKDHIKRGLRREVAPPPIARLIYF